MNIEKLKKYLQQYLDSVVTPRFLQDPNEDGIESFSVHDILKGSYTPPIIHVFLDSVPIINHPSNSTKTKLRQVERDIHEFIKMFAISNPVKVHLNKRPTFGKGKTRHEEI
jgi:hypothetical protein